MAIAPEAPSRPAAALPSKRVTAAQLAALAARVRTLGDRDAMEIEMPFTGAPLGTVPRCYGELQHAALIGAAEALRHGA